MGFVTSSNGGSRGLLHTDKPDWPRRSPFTDPEPVVRVADLRHQGKYDLAEATDTLPLALHHIVPWRLLVEFWNTLAAAGWYDPLRDFAALHGRPKAQTKYWPQDMAAGRFVDKDGAEDFGVTLHGWPCNLVRGPANRTGGRADRGVAGTDPSKDTSDPKSALDDLSRGNGKYALQVLDMLDVGRTMLAVVRAAPSLDTVDPDGLSKTIASWTVRAQRPLIEFDPAVWRIEMGSPDYKPPENNRPPVHPRWNKRTRADG